MRQETTPLVSVCVCTYRRPELLSQLLESLASQSLPHDEFEVLVVDNHELETGRPVVEAFAERFPHLRVSYEQEPVQGISFARNRTVRKSRGRFLAFIDDDETASPRWLEGLLATLRSGGFAAVLGPVIPVYPAGTPEWIKRSRFFDRRRYPTGTQIGSDDGRMGNALVDASLAKSRAPQTFDHRFAHSGGEDSDFFRWLEASGGRMGWNDEATVDEIVPHWRQSFSFMLARALRASTIYWRGRYASASWTVALLESTKGLTGAMIFGVLGALLLIGGRHFAARCWVVSAKGLGRVLALTKSNMRGY